MADKELKKAEIVEVPTQMGLAVKLENDEVVSQLELMVRCYNLLLKLEKAVA